MMTTDQERETGQTPRAPARSLVIAGLLCAGLGIVVYAAQVALGRLVIPWYLPASAALGAVLIAVSLWQKRSVWRTIALAVVVLMAAAEGIFLFATRLPPYTGPVAIGKPFPAFHTKRAAGAAFTDRDFSGDQTTVLIFFRGRW